MSGDLEKSLSLTRSGVVSMAKKTDVEIFDERIRENYLEVARSASGVLQGVLGQSADSVQEQWSVEIDPRGRELISLRLSDWTGAVEYKFAPQELGQNRHIERRLYRLWGDLLQVRSHVQADDYISGLQSLGAS